MMKKAYVKPEAEAIDFLIEETLMNDEDDDGVVDGSIGIGGEAPW